MQQYQTLCPLSKRERKNEEESYKDEKETVTLIMVVEMQTDQKRTGEIEEVTKRQADHQPDNTMDLIIIFTSTLTC